MGYDSMKRESGHDESFEERSGFPRGSRWGRGVVLTLKYMDIHAST
jgi:hypothetical protein